MMLGKTLHLVRWNHEGHHWIIRKGQCRMPEVWNATRAEDLDATWDYIEEQVGEAMELMPWADYDEIWNLREEMMISFREFMDA